MATDDLICVTQLPIIEERLRGLKSGIEAEVSKATSLACTEDTLQSVKAARADLRKLFDELEQKRKEVKAAVLGPYETFEAVYRECVSEPIRRGDADLKRKIDETEGAIKGRCEAELRGYFDELCAAHGLDWLTFEQAGVKVSMALARQKTPKRLREQIVNFVVGVSREVDAIAEMDDADEILAEYKESLDFADSIRVVSDRHRHIEAEHQSLYERAARKAAEAEAVRKVEALAPPTVKVEPETLTVTFTVTDTRERLIALREWLKANHYDYK